MDLDQLLAFDPLAAAEEFTGKSYKEDRETAALGLLGQMVNGEIKAELLKSMDDTRFSEDFDTCLRIAREEGFSVVYEQAFTDYMQGGPERYVILWKSGLLLTLESFGYTGRNMAKLYFNVRTDDWIEGSSGHFKDGVQVGYLDVREAFRHNLHRIEQKEVLTEWIERPFLWFVNYSQVHEEGYAYQVINEDVIARLPEHVQRAITPVEEN